MFLKVNREKTEVGYACEMKFLGYSFYQRPLDGMSRSRIHPKSLQKMRMKLKLITGRSNGMDYKCRKEVLHQTIRGWVNYFKLADAKKYLESIDEWLRRRIRMCI